MMKWHIIDTATFTDMGDRSQEDSWRFFFGESAYRCMRILNLMVGYNRYFVKQV